MDEEFTQIGQVKSVNPARREIRVSFPESRKADLEGREWVYVQKPGGRPFRCKVDKVSTLGTPAIVTLSSGVSRDTVADLKAAKVLVPTAELGPRDVSALKPAELVGMRVYTADDSLVGEVVDGFDTKANGVLEVRGPDGGSVLLPVVPELIEEIDWDRRRVIVHDIAPFAVESDSGPRLA